MGEDEAGKKRRTTRPGNPALPRAGRTSFSKKRTSKASLLMKEIVYFLIEAGKLKKKKRKGWLLRRVKNPETIAEHTFRMALMAWLLAKKRRLDLEKILKMALIHDLCEVYAGDTTPYDGILPKKRELRKEILSKWPRFTVKEKEEKTRKKHRKELISLEKITNDLPPSIKEEIKDLWIEYEEGLSKEGRFLRQIDRIENLLQALEYWKKEKDFSIDPWWIQMKELVDDPQLIKFMNTLDKYFHKNTP